MREHKRDRSILAVLCFAVTLLVLIASGEVSRGDAARTVTGVRSLVDRPDDIRGPQIHLVYAVPRDGADRHLDLDGQIASSFLTAQGWLAGQTGGRRLELDTANGEPDVTFLRLPETDRQIAGREEYAGTEIEALLRLLGFNSPTKNYEVFYDGSAPFCGSAPWPPEIPGRVAVLFLKGVVPRHPTCGSQPLASSYWQMSELHELMHTLGVVPTCAPHGSDDGHVSDSPRDLMYSGPRDWDTDHMVLDFHHDDYFDAQIRGCLDLSHSAFLQGGSEMPPARNAPPPRPSLCIVPALTGLTLARARRALRGADCRLGWVTRPATGGASRVIAQKPAATGVRARDSRVGVRLGSA